MSRQTRRNFLKRSTAAGIASTFVISGTKSSGNVLGANDTVRLGVAGIHGRGRSHIGAFNGQKNVMVTHLIDPDSRLFGGKDENSDPKCFQDIRKALEDKDLDAVSVATCNHWHSLITVWACQAGKDVYVEKPCSHNVFEGRQCVEAARKYKRIVQHGTQRRSGGHYKTVADIASGNRGKLTHVRGHSMKGRGSIGHKKPSDVPKELDFDIWLGPAPKQPYHGNLVHYNWHWFNDTGNGDIGNFGVHDMDEVRWTIPNATLPKSVIALGGRFRWNDQGETANLQLAVYDYGQTKLIFEVSNLGNSGSRSRTVFDKNGSAEPIKIVTPKDVKDPSSKRGPGGDIFKNFIACVRSRKSEDLDAHIVEAHYSASLCHLANISYNLGEKESFTDKPSALGDDPEVDKSFKWFVDMAKRAGVDMKEGTYKLGPLLKFDPATEKFTGNEKANALLTREYRKPFVVPEVV